jgi:hypothetical protein
MNHEQGFRTWNAQVTVNVTDVPRITFASGVEVQPHSLNIRWSEWSGGEPEWTVSVYKIKKDGSPGAVSRTVYHLPETPEWVTELIKHYTPTTLVTWND